VAGSPLLTASAAEFRAALPEGGVLLGIDTGTRRIGTATCDAGWRFATAGAAIPKGKFAADKAALQRIVAERAVKGLVIGLPLNMDGSESPRSQSALAFARNLAVLELPILLWDERWSTQAATRAVLAADLSRA
jgi:putative Holliday junction resolvase